MRTFEGAMQLFVENNPFEKYVVTLAGEAFQDDVVFADLPEGEVDKLVMGETRVDEPITVEFLVKNAMPDKVFRWVGAMWRILCASYIFAERHAGQDLQVGAGEASYCQASAVTAGV